MTVRSRHKATVKVLNSSPRQSFYPPSLCTTDLMSHLGPVLVLAAIFSLFYLAHKVVTYHQRIGWINNWPGFRTLLPDRFFYFPFRVSGISPGQRWSMYAKHDDFARAGTDILTSVSLFSSSVTFFVADPAIAQEVVGARSRFPKPVEAYDMLASFGSNILVTEGHEWKRQRKIAAPAFSEKNNRLVWNETYRIMEALFRDVWGDRKVVEVNHILEVTVPITLLVISIAGFGRRISWDDDIITPPGHSMTFKDALYEVSHRLMLRVILPDWLLRNGTTKMRYFAHAHDELKKYLAEMVQVRRDAEVKEERYDLFGSLLDANELEFDGNAKLTDSALLGNIFLFFVAGYETTAHTLAYAFILLALYQDEQEAFYENLKSVMPPGRPPTYQESDKLCYALAVFNETLRLFPPVVDLPKKSADDTSFTVTNAAGDKITIPVPRGSYVTIATPSLHRNPRYWDDPDVFKPARFLGNYPRQAFLPFSGGPRGCIGRGFGETEAVAVLSAIVSRYKVEIRDDARLAGETFEQRAARLLKSQQGLSVYPEHAPLVFKRR
ncbi:cytochrome P450 [Daedaleopsis nitida]|nr:cytochrome P450 [Daedaleopsis nitida]